MPFAYLSEPTMIILEFSIHLPI